jgi:hypothetical protein
VGFTGCGKAPERKRAALGGKGTGLAVPKTTLHPDGFSRWGTFLHTVLVIYPGKPYRSG